MYFVDNNTAVEVMPPVGAALYTKIMWFTESGLGGRATYPGPDWFNIIQAEMMNVVSAAGIELKKSDNTQLTQAIKKIIANGKYLTIANNLSEIAAAGEAAQADARKNLALGTAATLDVTTSTTDNTLGRVLKVGDRGLGLTGIVASNNFDFSTYEFAAGETLFINMSTAVNYPGDLSVLSGAYVYLHVTGIRDAAYDASFILAPHTGSGGIHFCKRSTDNDGNVGWFVNKLPTSAGDIGAVPQYDTVLNVDLNTLDGTKPGRYLQPMDAGALTEYHYPVSNAGSLDVIRNGANGSAGCTQEYRPFNTNVLYRRHSNIADSVVSWSGWNVEYSLEYQPPYPVTSVNGMTGDVTIPAPDLSGYQIANTAALGGNGWHKDTNTGLITQWGYIGGAGTLAFNFPIAFPSACVSVQIGNINESLLNSAPVVTGYNTTSVSFHVDTNTNASFIFVQGY